MTATIDLPERLHVAARRYCMERGDTWAATYSAMTRAGAGYNPTSGTYSNRARDVFPPARSRPTSSPR